MSDDHVVLQLLISIGDCVYWTVAILTVLEAEPLVYLCATKPSCKGWVYGLGYGLFEE